MPNKMNFNVLIVDDQPAIRELVGKAFESKGCTVSFASDGEEAVEVTYSIQFDLVAMDIDMYPGMDGISALELMKARGDTQFLPIVMLTNENHDDTIRKCKELGAFGFILKSDLNLHRLLQSIDIILESLHSGNRAMGELPFECSVVL